MCFPGDTGDNTLPGGATSVHPHPSRPSRLDRPPAGTKPSGKSREGSAWEFFWMSLPGHGHHVQGHILGTAKCHHVLSPAVLRPGSRPQTLPGATMSLPSSGTPSAASQGTAGATSRVTSLDAVRCHHVQGHILGHCQVPPHLFSSGVTSRVTSRDTARRHHVPSQQCHIQGHSQDAARCHHILPQGFGVSGAMGAPHAPSRIRWNSLGHAEQGTGDPTSLLVAPGLSHGRRVSQSSSGDTPGSSGLCRCRGGRGDPAIPGQELAAGSGPGGLLALVLRQRSALVTQGLQGQTGTWGTRVRGDTDWGQGQGEMGQRGHGLGTGIGDRDQSGQGHMGDGSEGTGIGDRNQDRDWGDKNWGTGTWRRQVRGDRDGDRVWGTGIRGDRD